ncbi:hypothetical protein [Staphylococcus hominis]|uniref:hypothetical protein n=1 Tax=Staphylococcus hominis TaxID=1290 RepID=UPI0011A196DA|nr:hypothetical protein [Staphylococcus hominis]
MASGIITKSTINSLTGAVKFLGGSVNDLNLKDYIAAQHLLEIINKLEKYLMRLSMKADKNCEIISHNDKCKKRREKLELLNLDEELYLFKMYKEALKSDAYRNLLSSDVIDDKIENELSLGILIERDSNITRELYEMKTKEQKISYESNLSQLAHFYKYENNQRRVTLDDIKTSVSIIASTSYVERIMLKYFPLKKVFLRHKK